MRNLKLLAILLLFSLYCHAQKDEAYYLKIIDSTKNKALKLASLDSLIHDVRNQKDLIKFAERTEQYVDLAIELEKYEKAAEKTIRAFFNINTKLGQRERSLALIEKVETHIDKITDSYLLGGIYLKKGGAYYNGKSYNKAIENYSLAIKNYASKDSIYKADAIYFRGQAYSFVAEYIKAINDYQLASKYYENLGDKEYMFFTEGSIVMIYGANGLSKKSIEARENLIQKRIEKNYLTGIGVDYYNLANNYLKIGDSLLFERTLKKAINHNKQDNNNFNNLSVFYDQFSIYYSNKNDLVNAKKYLDLSVNETINNEKNTLNIASQNKAKSLYLFKIGNIKEALELSLQNLKHEKSRNNLAGSREVNKLLSEIYEQKGDSKKALKYFKDYSNIKDSISTTDKTNTLSYYQTLYETEQKEKEITQQKNSIDLLAKENEAKQRLLLFGAIGASLLFLVFYFYRNRMQAIKKIKMQEEYSQKLLLSQEEERKRISKDLHDSLGQSLLLIKNKVSLKDDSQTKELVNNAIEEMRSISRVLHPFQLEEIGVSRAIENLISQLDENYKDILIFGDIDEIKDALNSNQEVNVFRIVQECFSNIIKHANADSAKIDLIDKEKEVIISIKDNGIGFDFSEKYNDFKSLGLKTIKERVKFLKGTLKIDSVKGEGTTFTIHFPKA
ncbi:sensor histidine kinase [Polaribacter pectinis]|uniref:Oxygen sensor histidine kinase NreB n=1 Tax=Polaribacter pectinis TaxID=2738844 RepID=A0A7G9L787_9FLAO|nr:sensor histidine kinase [Polaribacter pectinis]QNM84486.1 sensor histidine kinase [Polaribacter pectinis]